MRKVFFENAISFGVCVYNSEAPFTRPVNAGKKNDSE